MTEHCITIPRALVAFVLSGSVMDSPWAELDVAKLPAELPERIEHLINDSLRAGIDHPDVRTRILGACVSKFIPSKNFADIAACYAGGPEEKSGVGLDGIFTRGDLLRRMERLTVHTTRNWLMRRVFSELGGSPGQWAGERDDETLVFPFDGPVDWSGLGDGKRSTERDELEFGLNHLLSQMTGIGGAGAKLRQDDFGHWMNRMSRLMNALGTVSESNEAWPASAHFDCFFSEVSVFDLRDDDSESSPIENSDPLVLAEVFLV